MALQELGSMAKDVIKILKHAGASGVEEYNGRPTLINTGVPHVALRMLIISTIYGFDYKPN